METTFYENTLLKFREISHAEQEVSLLERISNADETALSELYDKYSKLLFSIILKIVKSQEEAEDMLQKVFIKIWNNTYRFDRTKGSVYAWVTTLARNSAIDRIRSKQYKENVGQFMKYYDDEIRINSKELTGFDLTLNQERIDFVTKALTQISDDQKIVIELAYYNGMTQAEISEQLDVPLGTVKTRMRQALIKLGKILNQFID